MKVLVWGVGSIGSRHAKNFLALGQEVALCSARSHEGYPCFKDITSALDSFNPQYVVISNETSKHLPSLEVVLRKNGVQRVLVEKPMLAKASDALRQLPVEKIAVAYNLRFHALTKMLRTRLGNSPILSWNAYVGQNLLTWRPDRDYRQVYSSSKHLGGGIMRDLSHELDLLQFFAGKLELQSGTYGKNSHLEGDVEDVASFILKTSRCGHANVHMNGLDHLTQRFLTVITDTETFHLDFIKGTFRDRTGDINVKTDSNDSYLEMARAFLNNDGTFCDYTGGLKIAQLIDQMEAK